MQTVLEIIRKTAPWLEKRGVANARLDTELLLAHLLKCKRLDLYLQFERPLEEALLQSLRPLVKRRGEREPLQYIIGTTSFCGHEILCDKRALIPRQETEQLVELIVAKVARDKMNRILELGTGTAAIAIALAHEYPEASITAVDISAEALALAGENVARSGVSSRIQLLNSDWFSQVQGEFELIVSNPPYLSKEEVASAEPEVREFEPQGALTAGDEGLEALARILKEGKSRLSVDGQIFLETGIAHAEKLQAISLEAGYSQSSAYKDLQGRSRFFRAQA